MAENMSEQMHRRGVMGPLFFEGTATGAEYIDIEETKTIQRSIFFESSLNI
jgi:hypothetical protein